MGYHFALQCGILPYSFGSKFHRNDKNSDKLRFDLMLSAAPPRRTDP